VFLFKLALAMGRPDVDKLAEELTPNQIVEWMAYWQIEPWGDDWRRTARGSVLVAMAMGAKLKPDHETMMMPGFDPFEQMLTPEEMRAKFERIKNNHGRNDKNCRQVYGGHRKP